MVLPVCPSLSNCLPTTTRWYPSGGTVRAGLQQDVVVHRQGRLCLRCRMVPGMVFGETVPLARGNKSTPGQPVCPAAGEVQGPAGERASPTPHLGNSGRCTAARRPWTGRRNCNSGCTSRSARTCAARGEGDLGAPVGQINGSSGIAPTVKSAARPNTPTDAFYTFHVSLLRSCCGDSGGPSSQPGHEVVLEYPPGQAVQAARTLST